MTSLSIFPLLPPSPPAIILANGATSSANQISAPSSSKPLIPQAAESSLTNNLNSHAYLSYQPNRALPSLRNEHDILWLHARLWLAAAA